MLHSPETPRGCRARLLPAALALAALVPSVAIADTPSDDWQWAATVYLWLPSLGGETAFPPDNSGPSVGITAEQILDSLNFAFMGAFEGRKGPWSLATDVIYLDLGAARKGTRDFSLGRFEIPADVDANLRLEVTGWLWTAAGGYALVQHENASLSVIAGARMLDLEETLDWKLNGDISSLPIVDRAGSSQAGTTQWDAIVGLKGRATFGAQRQWYVPYYLDVGAGESDLTWQGMVGVGYSFESVDVVGVWRYLDYDLGNATPIRTLNLSGPTVGVTYRF